jgi:hypothetical protein
MHPLKPPQPPQPTTCMNFEANTAMDLTALRQHRPIRSLLSAAANILVSHLINSHSTRSPWNLLRRQDSKAQDSRPEFKPSKAVVSLPHLRCGIQNLMRAAPHRQGNRRETMRLFSAKCPMKGHRGAVKGPDRNLGHVRAVGT